VTAIAHAVQSRLRDLGGFEVRRILPFGGAHMVGPFIFLDHLGPVTFAAGQGIDVRPHPHACLATVTYLFDGEIEHRDSLGVVQTIRPGDVNWMTAGSGIAHSERRSKASAISGGISWRVRPNASSAQSANGRTESFRRFPERPGSSRCRQPSPLTPALSPNIGGEGEGKAGRPSVALLHFSSFSAQGRNSVDTALAEPSGAGDGAWRATRGQAIPSLTCPRARGMRWRPFKKSAGPGKG